MRRSIWRWKTRAGAPLLTALLLLAPGITAAEEAVVGQVSGVVERSHGEPPSWQAVASGDALAAGERLRTGRDGRAELIWRGATIRLYGDSVLRLPTAAASTRSLDLEGDGLFDVEPRDGEPFDVHTADVVVSVKGTRFGVSADPAQAAEVRVYRGTVGVRGIDAQMREVLVREGFRSVGGAADAAEIFLLDQPDPWDDWIRQAAARASTVGPAAPARHEALTRKARDRALNLALDRNPKLAERLVEMRRNMREAMDADEQAVDDVQGSKIDDPVLDATKAEGDRLLRSQYVEEVLNVPGVNVELSSKGMIEIADSGRGQVWQLDEDALVDVIEGTGSLPSGLDAALGATQPDEQLEVATVLLGLLGR